MNPFYTDYSEYLARFYGSQKVQKISINSGNNCPNRDGTIGTGGCIYCNNHSFTPAYCFKTHDIIEQIECGKSFFARKYADMKFLAYFQSYTSTYRQSVDRLRQLLERIVADPDIVGIIVGTRPDCFGSDMAEMFAGINSLCPVFVEFGVESMHDATLRLINRGHSCADAVKAIKLAAAYGLHVGVHLIAGLPGERKKDLLQSLESVCCLPIESVKMHHLQILRNTPLLRLCESGALDVTPFSLEEYLDLCCEMVSTVPRHIAIERFLSAAPPDMVIAPKWGIKNYEFTNLLINKLKNRKYDE